MRESPRDRRLRSDLRALEQLRSESSIFDFLATGPAPEEYSLHFMGRGVYRETGGDRVLPRDHHEVALRLGASYPRSLPSLLWKTPIYHPNVAGSGHVCLGGYGSHWAPSVTLDEVCRMLWDMIRYANFDPASPYNRDAALWANAPHGYAFPLDRRPLRDITAAQGAPRKATAGTPAASTNHATSKRPLLQSPTPEMTFLGSNDIVVTAEVIGESNTRNASGDDGDDGIVFIS